MKVTYHALRVLRHLLVNPEPCCGAEIIRALDMGSGTVYTMLARLRLERWITLTVSLPAPNAPPSHFYQLTPAGRAAFLDMLARLTIPDDLWRSPDA